MSIGKEIECSYCENKFTVISDAEDPIEYCPFCGDDLYVEEDEDDYPELDFGDEDDR